MSIRKLGIGGLALVALLAALGALALPALAAAPETPVTEAASGVTTTGATLNGTLNPGAPGEAGEYEFTYAVSAGECAGPAAPEPPATDLGKEREAVSVTLTGLQPSTEYAFCLIALHEGEASTGTLVTFKTLAIVPFASTGQAQGVTRTTARLSGSVNPLGAETTYRFAYIDQAGYEAALAQSASNPYANGAITPASDIGSEAGSHAVGPLEISELTPGTTYHYALIATTSVGTTVTGSDQTFTTLSPTPPVATSGQATSVSQVSAMLTGSVDTQGLQTTIDFELGTTPALGSTELTSVLFEAGTNVGVEAVLEKDLQPGVTYYYRVVATSQDGTSYGNELSFTTASFPGLAEASPPPPDLTGVVPIPAAKESVASSKGKKAKTKSGKKAKMKHKKTDKRTARRSISTDKGHENAKGRK